MDPVPDTLPVPEIKVSPNPAPKRSYALTLRFAGLPAAINQVTVYADYDVENIDCVPLDYTKAVGGIRLPPEHRLELSLHRVDENTYTATVHEDALQDEDYYGLGVCQWALAGATVHFSSPTTQFISGINADELAAEQETTDHYLARDFNQKPALLDFVFGKDSADYYLANLGPQFTLNIKANREAQ
ncbi:MAG: hypothetical protein E6Q88_01850 [Lysobacteraceae bacterium]|nr:MAG: hypothetical protein E6Q88_01850 [Xanthomonadaceae bacterium]